jgi:LacI family transcriptional regulator
MSNLAELKALQSKPGRPLYATVKEAVRAAIDRGRFAPGTQLPSTKAISDEMGVSLVTVHRAMQELVASGVLVRGQGRGTFVHEDYAKRSTTAHGLRFGLVFHAESSLADAYHGQILEGVRQRANELGVDLVLLRFGEDTRNECQGYLFVNPLREQLDKPLRFGMKAPSGNGKDRESRNLAVTVVGARYAATGANVIDTDNTGIGRQAVEHLTRLGHTRLGFVGGGGTISNDVDRWTGFSEAAGALGGRVRPEHAIRHAGWRLDDEGRQRLLNMLASVERPTAIFAAGYYFALDVYAAAAAAGLKIPQDLSVIGVDDPPSAHHLHPPMTTFRQPLINLGRMAVGGLYETLNSQERVPHQITLPAELVQRGSTAPLT